MQGHSEIVNIDLISPFEEIEKNEKLTQKSSLQMRLIRYKVIFYFGFYFESL